MSTIAIIGFSMLLLAVSPAISAGQAAVSLEETPNARLLSLEEAVQLALVNNLNLLSTMDQVSGAQISEGLAGSQFGLKVTPSFTGGVGSETASDQRYGVDVSKLLPFGATVSASVNSDVARNDLGKITNSNLSIGVRQPLLRGFGPRSTQYNLTNARRNLETSNRNLELTRQRLAVDVVAGYYNILRQRGLVEVAQGSLERSKELLRASEARLEVGLASKLDVFRAELQISQAEEGVINRQEALELALDNFKFKLGLDPGEEVALEMVEPEYQPLALDLDELTRTALDNRVEVIEERARIGDSQRTLSVSRQNLLPQLDLNVRYQQRGLGSSFAESFDFQYSDVNVFLSTSYQLDQSAERASYALAQIDIEARRRNLKLVEYNVSNEVRAAARNVERLAKSILLQEKNIDFAEKQRRLANLRYQRGLASNFDIIDAENNVIQANSNYVSLLADYFVALIELKRVTGTLDLQKEFAPGRFLPPGRFHP
jgi:outer membrane protein